MTTRAQMINWAAAQLAAGILASNLPGRLMEEFKIPPSAARRIAGAAIRKQKRDKGVRQ